MRNEEQSRPVQGTRPNVVINTQAVINQHLDLVKAHDAIHADRSECGGVGGCKVLMAEVESIREVDEYLGHLSKMGSLYLHLAPQEQP